MSAASDYLENKLLDHVLKFGNGSVTVGSGAGYAPPATLYVALFTAHTGLESNSPSAEVSTGGGTNYARQTITFAAAGATTQGSSISNATVTFPAATANYGTVSHVALMDASTAGNVLFHGAVTTSKLIETGDTFQISSGNLTISLA